MWSGCEGGGESWDLRAVGAFETASDQLTCGGVIGQSLGRAVVGTGGRAGYSLS